MLNFSLTSLVLLDRVIQKKLTWCNEVATGKIHGQTTASSQKKKGFIAFLEGGRPEIWFGILTRQSLRGVSFVSTEKLCTHISAFIKSYNPTAKPFIWRKREVKGAQLKNIAQNFCN